MREVIQFIQNPPQFSRAQQQAYWASWSTLLASGQNGRWQLRQPKQASSTPAGVTTTASSGTSSFRKRQWPCHSPRLPQEVRKRLGT